MMTHLTGLLGCLLLIWNNAMAQPQSPCTALIANCGNSIVSHTPCLGVMPGPYVIGCHCGLFGYLLENATYVRIPVTKDGLLTFALTPDSSSDDYDFAIFNITGQNCTSIAYAYWGGPGGMTQLDYLGENNIVRCNLGYSPGMTTGLNTASTATSILAGQPFCAGINAHIGEEYLIAINNCAHPGTPYGGFIMDFNGATCFATDLPQMVSIQPSCGYQEQLVVQLNEAVICSSIAPDGSDFKLAGGGEILSAQPVDCSNSGITDKVRVRFLNPLSAGSYTLLSQTGIDGNTILSSCNNLQLPVNSLLPFTVSGREDLKFSSVLSSYCQELHVVMNRKISCVSLAADGSDFFLTGPQQANITGAYIPGCDSNNAGDTIVILLDRPLQTDGVYQINVRTSNANTIMDSCSYLYLPDGASISFVINSFDGQVIASPDTVLCGGGVIVPLTSTCTAVPPLQSVNCGSVSGGPSNAAVSSFFSSGKKENNTIVNSPFFEYRDAYDRWAMSGSRMQVLYTASELRRIGMKPGIIQSIGVDVLAKKSNFGFDNFSIKIGCTDSSEINETLISDLAQVYNTPSYNSVSGWNVFQFDKPYTWDGHSNIVVEFCHDIVYQWSAPPGFPEVPSDSVAHTITEFNSVLHIVGMHGCAAVIGDDVFNANNTFNYNRRRVRPKIRFDMAEPPADVLKYTWAPGSDLADSGRPSTLAFVQNSTRYTISVVDRYGCLHRDTTNVRIDTLRTYTFTAFDTLACQGNPVQLIAPLPDSTVNDWKYAWSSGQASCCISVNNGGVYTLAMNRFCEEGSKQYNIAFDNCDQCIWVPTAFSPNNDGKNDVFRVRTTCPVVVYNVVIVNRWGQVVFDSQRENAVEWNGLFGNTPVDAGVYYYYINAYSKLRSEPITLKGDITVIR